jgi:selenide,water dikinase
VAVAKVALVSSSLPTTSPPLTSLAATAGCAAKIAQVDLIAVLAHLPRSTDPRVLVGLETGDDAAVIRLRDDLALVQTTDIFTPIVDDPFVYGQIAAANALSDIYAMGATPLSALSFVAWPMQVAGPEALAEVLRGAAERCQVAGIAITGGHSIVDNEPKFGLFVTGLVHPEEIVRNDGARPGDLLVLTKALGTGVLVTAAKRGLIEPDALAPAIASMVALNAGAAAAMEEVGVHAATDVTGFGLLGHLGNVLRASSHAAGQALGAALVWEELPWLPRALELAAAGACPGGSKKNLAFAAPNCRFDPGLAEHETLLLADAQTSGGLLLAVRPSRLPALLAALAHHGVVIRAVIGEVTNADLPGEIVVRKQGITAQG